MVFRNVISLILISMLTSSCALWPYKKDFDCPIPEGLKCKSLYEVSVMADSGQFGPKKNKQEEKLWPCTTCRVAHSKYRK